jgi:hypothetical protein
MAPIASNTIVKVHFGDAIRGGHSEYVARITGFQPGHIGCYYIEWLETIPGYMTRGTADLIEQERISCF